MSQSQEGQEEQNSPSADGMIEKELTDTSRKYLKIEDILKPSHEGSDQTSDIVIPFPQYFF
jgi:hypothetical protein